MTESAQRMREMRQRNKEKGMKSYTVVLSAEQSADLDRCIELSNDVTRNDFLAKSLVTGAKFRLNSGGTLKDKISSK